MSISLPISVRIRTARQDSNITQEIRDLTFRSAIPGGFASLQMSLNRPLNIQPNDIGYYAQVFVYDTRNGSIVWEGWLEDPGRTAGSDGELWSISAVGPSAHAQDQFLPLVYVDRSLDGWKRSRYSTHGAHTEITEVDDVLSGNGTNEEANQALSIYAEEGSSVPTTWMGDWIYRAPRYGGQLIARVRADYVCEGASTNYRAKIVPRHNAEGAFAPPSQYDADWVTTPAIVGLNYASGLDFTANAVSFRAERNNTATTADNKARVYFYNVVVRCAIKKLDGTDNLSTVGYGVNNIDPNEVVTDLLGRCLKRFDGPGANIVGSGVDIEQLAYRDGVTPAQVLDDIAVFDPGFYWAAWETATFNSPTKNKHRFEYIPWPTTVRYEATVLDGFDSPGSAVDLYNEVVVRWIDSQGVVRNVTRTQTVPELSAAGITRRYWIDLSDEIGTAQNATYTGDNFLAEHKYPPNAGTLTIARPILDRVSARMVMPWEIRPGNLIRVRGVLPRVDALNPTNRDGVTVFRVISTEFNASSGTVSLELDSMSRTVARALASLKNQRFRKR